MATASKGKNNILIIVGVVVVIGAAGWFGWQHFSEAPPPPPGKAAKPAAPAAPAAKAPTTQPQSAARQDKLIEDILAVSGMDHMLAQLPEQMLAGAMSTRKQDKKARLSADEMREMERAVKEAFPAQGFRQQVVARFKKNYDQKRYQALLDDISTPLAKRMAELEKKQPKPEDLAAFSAGLASRPMSAERVALVQRIDAASRSSELAAEAMFSSIRGVVRGAAGEGSKQAADLDKFLEKQRAAAEDGISNSTRMSLAYTYREVSDADLAEYTKIYEKEGNKWVLGLAYDALLDEFRSGSERLGADLGKMAKAKQDAKLAAGPAGKKTAKGGKSAAPVYGAADAQADQPKAQRQAGPSRAGEDARMCLDIEDNRKIMQCAEKYR